MECGDWSPLFRRRLVAVELPGGSSHPRTPALARAVNTPSHLHASRSLTATSRLEKAATSPALYPDRRSFTAIVARGDGSRAAIQRGRAGTASSTPGFWIGLPSATLCVASHLCGVLTRLAALRGRTVAWQPVQNTAEMGRNAENAGVCFGIRRQASATPRSPAVAGKILCDDPYQEQDQSPHSKTVALRRPGNGASRFV